MNSPRRAGNSPNVAAGQCEWKGRPSAASVGKAHTYQLGRGRGAAPPAAEGLAVAARHAAVLGGGPPLLAVPPHWCAITRARVVNCMTERAPKQLLHQQQTK